MHHAGAALGRSDDATRVVGRTNVGCASAQSFSPHLFVRVPVSFQSGTRMARPGASHSASAESPPCLQLPRVPCGMKRKASYPPRRASKISPGALHPFPIPGQSFPGVGDTLQIWPSGETPKPLYPVFALRISGKNCMAEEAMVVL